MTAPDWPRVAEALKRPIHERTDVHWRLVHDAARFALVHGPALEAAPTIWWCEEHAATSYMASSDIDRERCWWKMLINGHGDCRMVERRLLPGEDE